jgi:restriction system protein
MLSYEELMMPLFQRLGGEPEHIGMDDLQQDHAAPQPPVSASQCLIEETANVLAASHRVACRSLEEEVLAHVYAQTPGFFEGLIIDLLLTMGYGSRRRDLSMQLGRSHDGGVDGVITQDLLGLDVILIQAKRLKPNTRVTAAQIRDFLGSLETRKASKGIFVTTGDFSSFARDAAQCASRRLRLIGGRELSSLMVRHNLGVRPSQSFVFKTLDTAYFRNVRA